MACRVDDEGIGQALLPAFTAFLISFEALVLQNLKEHLFLKAQAGCWNPWQGDLVPVVSNPDSQSPKSEPENNTARLLRNCLRLAEPVDACFPQSLSKTFQPKLPSVSGPSDFELLGEGKLTEL